MCLLLVSRSIFDVVYIYASCVLNCDDLVIYGLVLWLCVIAVCDS